MKVRVRVRIRVRVRVRVREDHRDLVLFTVERRPGLQRAATAAEGEVQERGGCRVAVVEPG